MNVFVDAAAFDEGIGRWSRPLARELVAWLAARRDARWLDVGAGTGAVTAAILDLAWPGEVTGVDTSVPFLERARSRVTGARFVEGDATALPFTEPAFDVTVASLVVAALPDPGAALREMARVTVSGGMVAIAAWDADLYLTRHYWDAVEDPAADPRRILPIRDQRTVHEALGGAGLREVHTRRLEATVTFDSFDALWIALTGRQGHTAAHLNALPEAERERARQRTAELMGARTGPVALTGAVWAGRGLR